MIAERTKLVFSIGFTFGVIVVGILNYLTFLHPRWYRSPSGSLISHDPLYSGFPFDMYAHGYLNNDDLLALGLIGNVLVALTVCIVLGWLATKIPARKNPLK